MERSPRVPVLHGQRVAEPGLLPRLSERLTALCSPISKRVYVEEKVPKTIASDTQAALTVCFVSFSVLST